MVNIGYARVSTEEQSLKVAWIGAGATIVAALIVGVFTFTGKAGTESQLTSGSVTIGEVSGGAVHTGEGDIYVTNVQGVMENQTLALAKQLGDNGRDIGLAKVCKEPPATPFVSTL